MISNGDILKAVYKHIDFERLQRACPDATRKRVAKVFGLRDGRRAGKKARTPQASVSLVINADGGSRGNPGPSAIGVLICNAKGKVIDRIGECIGRATNNVAEYRAMIRGAERAVELGAGHVTFCVDSELLAKQVSGEYKTRSRNLVPLLIELRGLLDRIPEWQVRHVPRKQNARADALVNRALDAKK